MSKKFMERKNKVLFSKLIKNVELEHELEQQGRIKASAKISDGQKGTKLKK